MNANDFVALALRSPLHAVLGATMLITVTGRKTGKKITLPVNYNRVGNIVWVISSRDRTWWRNLVGGAEVGLRMKGQDVTAFGEAIVDEAAVAAQLIEYARRLPGSARSLGLRVENGVPNGEDLARVSKERLFVRVCLQP
jgi:F420H(2)-dependent quinone reductase